MARLAWALGLSLWTVAACGGSSAKIATPAVSDDAPACVETAARLRADGRAFLIVDSYRDDCMGGELICCEHLARELAERDSSADRIADALEPVCEEGGPAGCLRAGDIVGDRAPDRAAAFYERSCRDFGRELQNTPREPEVCRDALDRLVLLESYEVARRVARQLCRATVETGCATLGELWREGKGGERDLGAAYEYVLRACHAGDHGACGRREELLEALKSERAAATTAGCDDLPRELRDVSMQDHHVRIASFEAGGLRFCVMACRMAGPGGGLDTALIGPLVAEAMARRGAELDACGDEKAPIPLRWRIENHHIVDVQANVDEPTKSCVEQTLEDLQVPFDATCEGTFRLP